MVEEYGGDDEGDGGDDAEDSSLLVHVGSSGELHRRVMPVNFSKVAAVLDDEERGALIHCRNHDNRWKRRAVWEQEWDGEGEGIEAWKDCPGRADLVTDGMGGVWVLKKVGKRNNKRAMSYVNRNGELIEGRGESFLGVAVMDG